MGHLNCTKHIGLLGKHQLNCLELNVVSGHNGYDGYIDGGARLTREGWIAKKEEEGGKGGRE